MAGPLGERLGDYELLTRLGRGGMGEVYQARGPAGEVVALKLLEGRYDPDDPALVRFRREGQVHASLEHPGIVQARGGLEVTDERAYYVMDYVAGEDLGRLLDREGPLAPGRAVGLALQILEALAYAHAQGVIHRDLKPSNVLLDADERPRLADFGLARMAGLSSLTQTGTVLGTPEYMSPEQARGEEAGVPADVYAMGCLLAAMLQGRPPFQAPQPLPILRMHLEDPVPALAAPAPLPVGLEGIVRRALAKAPAERWPSAQDMADALAALDLASQASVSPPGLASAETAELSPLAAGADPARAETLPLGAHPDPARAETLPLGAGATPASAAAPALVAAPAQAPPPQPRFAGWPGLVLLALGLGGLGWVAQSLRTTPTPPLRPTPSPTAAPPSSPTPARSSSSPSPSPSASPTAPARRIEVVLVAGEQVVGELIELDLVGGRIRVRVEGAERAFALDEVQSYRYLD